MLVYLLLILEEAGEGRDVIVQSLGLACKWFSVNFPPSQSGGRVSEPENKLFHAARLVHTVRARQRSG